MTSTTPTPSSFARPQRERAAQNPEDRGSLLRASILESALELGVGTNRTVANWIFNPVAEADEEEETEVNSPSLTYASTATSEESNLSAGSSQFSQPGAGILIHGKDDLSVDTSLRAPRRHALSPSPAVQFDLSVTPSPTHYTPAPSPTPSLAISNGKNKLRKPRPDGYESDGGYVSESGKAKKVREKKEKKEQKEREKAEKKSKKKAKGDGAATDYDSDGGYVSETSAKRKKSKKEKTEKGSKLAEPSTTDYETDGGKSKTKSRKQKVTSPVDGDDSDGGYLSESTKKRRFFSLKGKSRSKQGSLDAQDPPPVPSLPPIHPIADKFGTTGSDSFDTWSSNAGFSETSSVRPSEDTFTTGGSTSLDLSTDGTSVEDDEELSAPGGLTQAFQDAESVRSPSVDVLSAFGRRRAISPGGRPLSPSRFAIPPSPSPTPSPSKVARARPIISAPNTTTLAQKHIPMPLTLTPPTPTGTSHRVPASPDPDYVVVTPTPDLTPNVQAHSSKPSFTSITDPLTDAEMTRPKVLAYYDLPPPSPPPTGPLPDVPHDVSSRATSPSPSMMDDASRNRYPAPRTAPADSTDPRGLQRPMASPHVRAPPASAQGFHGEIPTIQEPSSPAVVQRGRVSPFPTAPVLPRSHANELLKQTTRNTREAFERAQRNGSIDRSVERGPASASVYASGHQRWPSEEQRMVVQKGPSSAQAGMGNGWPSRGAGQLNVRWQPRSSSAMEMRRPDDEPEDEDEGVDRRSWISFDDGHSDHGKMTVASAEPSPDVNTILAGFRAQQMSDAAAKTGSRETIASDYGRDSVYLGIEDEGADRGSMWSEAESRASFIDGERSAAIRAKFVQRVEAMYGKEIVPPVPRLDQNARAG